MAKLVKKISKKAGLPPGTLVHIGEDQKERVKLRLIDYTEAGLEERQLNTIFESFPYKDKDSVTWLDIVGVHEVDVIGALGKYYNLHPLLLEDVMNTDQRPKLDDYEDNLCLFLKILSYDDSIHRLRVEQVSIVFGPHFVFTFQERDNPLFEPVRDRLRKARGRIRKLGPDYLAYSLIDAVVDSYFAVLEKTGERIEALEEELVNNPQPRTSRQIHLLKKDLILLRKAVWPLREVVNTLVKEDSPLIQERTKLFLRDIYDHTVHVIETLETFREIASEMIDVYLSSVSNRMNEVMKVLTIIATIFIPLTYIVGIYGMNFKVMPELEWSYGYPLLWLIMLGVAFTMLVLFRRKKWL
ncbi:MAG: magnesium/cobalt transporter CorA [Desulfobacterota bacterium]|nr:magnesium/cobalt transporter CorA [Thermodesulfobacteriota bacterium]